MFWTAPPSSNSGKWRLAGIPGSKNGIVLVLTLTGWGSIPTQSCQHIHFEATNQSQKGNQPVTFGTSTMASQTPIHCAGRFWALHVWRKPKHYCPKKCGVGKSSLSTAEAWAYNCKAFHEFVALPPHELEEGAWKTWHPHDIFFTYTICYRYIQIIRRETCPIFWIAWWYWYVEVLLFAEPNQRHQGSSSYVIRSHLTTSEHCMSSPKKTGTLLEPEPTKLKEWQ